jgi:hypothetical protein
MHDESAAHQPIRWRPRHGLICCSIRPIPLPPLSQHPTNTSVAHWTEGTAHPGRFALQRLRRGDRHLSLLLPPSYRRRLLESPRPTTPPPRTITRQRQYEQGGESICELIIAFWGCEMIFLASNIILPDNFTTYLVCKAFSCCLINYAGTMQQSATSGAILYEGFDY